MMLSQIKLHVDELWKRCLLVTGFFFLGKEARTSTGHGSLIATSRPKLRTGPEPTVSGRS